MILHPALILAIPAAPIANAPDGRPVLNSFVDHRVASVHELIAQVRNDRVVADRYERHFSMTRLELIGYLGGLHRAPLAQTGTYTIYSVPSDGHVKMHRGVIRKGEPMFVNARNQPILVVKCGNPVVLGPKRPSSQNDLQLDLEKPDRARDMVLEDAKVSDPLSMIPAEPSEILTASETLLTPEAPVLSTVGTLATASHGLPWLGTLSALAPVVVSRGGHSPSIGITPVPEPASIGAFGLGALALFRRRRR